jgi:hypothetical protein
MDLGLSDRIVVVTGASKGLAYDCAAAFTGEGARVALFLAWDQASYVTGAIVPMDGRSNPVIREYRRASGARLPFLHPSATAQRLRAPHVTPEN